VGFTAQAREYLRCLLQIRRLTDDFISKRDERIRCNDNGIGARLGDDIPLRMAFQSVSSRNVKAASNFSASRGGAISNSNPATESNAARLGELDASTSEGMAW